MVIAGEARIRRSEAHEILLQRMITDAQFPTMRDAMLFAAGVGIHMNRKVALSKTFGDSVRYEIMIKEAFSDAFISMMAASETDDPEILDDERLDERLKTFEQYMVGGFEVIQETMNSRAQPVELVVSSLVSDALTDSIVVKPATIEDLLDGF